MLVTFENCLKVMLDEESDSLIKRMAYISGRGSENVYLIEIKVRPIDMPTKMK